MNKKELKDKLNEVVLQIKSNSKDAHYCDTLIQELLSLKGQIDIQPTELDCGKKTDEYDGGLYRITITDKGVLYHEYGGYSIFVRPNITSLYDTLVSIVDIQKNSASFSKEEKEQYDLTTSAASYCLSVPKIVFTDADLTFKIATEVIEHIQSKYDELLGQDLQEETPIENAQFEEATKAMESLKELSKE